MRQLWVPDPAPPLPSLSSNHITDTNTRPNLGACALPGAGCFPDPAKVPTAIQTATCCPRHRMSLASPSQSTAQPHSPTRPPPQRAQRPAAHLGHRLVRRPRCARFVLLPPALPIPALPLLCTAAATRPSRQARRGQRQGRRHRRRSCCCRRCGRGLSAGGRTARCRLARLEDEGLLQLVPRDKAPDVEWLPAEEGWSRMDVWLLGGGAGCKKWGAAACGPPALRLSLASQKYAINL